MSGYRIAEEELADEDRAEYRANIIKKQSKDKDAVEHEMQEKTFEYQQDKLEFIKNPVVVEFLAWKRTAICQQV